MGNEITVRPKLERRTRIGNNRRTAAAKAYRAKIESLLAESGDEPLADVWQRVCPFHIDLGCEVPDRRGIIEDLADFAEVLKPNLNGMKPRRLCWLIEEYAVPESRQSNQSFSPPVCPTGTLMHRISREHCSELVATPLGCSE